MRVWSLYAMIVIVLLGAYTIVYQVGLSNDPRIRELGAARNATLGFEKLVVVSQKPSWRSKGLKDIAKSLNLEMVFPFQPDWPQHVVDLFRGVDAVTRQSPLGPGQARCWLGHINVWKEIARRGWQTALVLEDDVDFDVSLKKQMAFVAPMIQKASKNNETVVGSPYGTAWDLLWLGHCGDNVPSYGVVRKFDGTLPLSPLYQENDGRQTLFPAQTRMVHRSFQAICTYAYAVTFNAAARMLENVPTGADTIITFYIQDLCKRGLLRCYTVNPELFHHHKKQGEIISQIGMVEGWQEDSIPAEADFTPNIRYSARCNVGKTRLVSCR